jgi:GNAT superfamily N-acetyltransferase
VAQVDRWLEQSGRGRWTLFVRDPSGACVGGTNVELAPWEPATVFQDDTGIDPDHRGRGLGKWVKAAMLMKVRAELPDAERVVTGNAFSNAPMLAINDTLGFVVNRTRTEWQVEVPAVRAAVDRPGWDRSPLS